MSFAFITKKDSWDKEGDKNIRTLLDVDLHDVSAVTYPAYLNTEIGLRSLQYYQELEHERKMEIQKRMNLVQILKIK
jgi:phage head maturation protease